MVQTLMKIGKVLLILGLIYFALWTVGQFGFDLKGVVLHTASLVPGLHDLPQKYDLGDKRSTLLKDRQGKLDARERKLKENEKQLAELPKREAELQKREDMLRVNQQRLRADRNKLLKAQKDLLAAEKKLDKEKSDFAFKQNKWLEDFPGGMPKKTGQSDYVAVPGNINPPVTSDAKIKEYLTMLGKMKPKQAAMIIQKLPEETVFTIFDQLNQYQVIKIMENLPEDYLAKLTQDRLNKYRNF